jgi:ABC-type dipeptide/oligopeptide/nickel transport system permease subunit
MRYHVSVVAEFFIQMVVALPVLLLWFAVVTLIGVLSGSDCRFAVCGSAMAPRKASPFHSTCG